MQCPRCEQTAEVWVLEDAGAPFTESPRRRYGPRSGFTADEADLACEACGAVFPGP